MSQDKFNQAFVLLLLLFISAVFLAMVWPFLMTIIMAGIFSALTRPLYRWLKRRFGGRSGLAAADGPTARAYYRLIDQPDERGPDMAQILAPHRQQSAVANQRRIDIGAPQSGQAGGMASPA